MLDGLAYLGALADNTIVQYSTDNGPHYNTWPDAGTTPFRSEKNSNWEGAFRVPCSIRWMIDRAFVLAPLQAVASEFLLSLKEFPPSQTPGDWSLDSLEKQIKGMTVGGD